MHDEMEIPSQRQTKSKFDENGFRVGEGHVEEIDWSFMQGKLDNAHEDAAFSISGELQRHIQSREREMKDEFESLVDGAQG